MANRKSINDHTTKYFVAVRNCINVLVFYYLEVSFC